MMDPGMVFIMVACGLAIGGFVYHEIVVEEVLPKVDLREYEEYQSPPDLYKHWYKNPKANVCCDTCGMNDTCCFSQIIYSVSGAEKQTLCKWCAELRAIRLHLQTHGQRRFTKAA